MTNESYQTIQELRKEIEQYAISGITSVEIYKSVKHNPKAIREFTSQLKSALEKLTQENPGLAKEIPILFKPKTSTRIPIQSQ